MTPSTPGRPKPSMLSPPALPSPLLLLSRSQFQPTAHLSPRTTSAFSPLLCPSPNLQAAKSRPWVTAPADVQASSPRSPPFRSTVYVIGCSPLTPGLCTCCSPCLRLPFPALFPCLAVPELISSRPLSVLSYSAGFTTLPEVLGGEGKTGWVFFSFFFHCISPLATRTPSNTEPNQGKGM